MKLPYGIIEVDRVYHNRKTGQWCKIPYPNHPKGCPKYGEDDCPPNTPFITEVLDLRRPTYIAFSEFNLHAHVETMRSKYPLWSERQLRNVLYWQNTSRKQMRQRARIARFIRGADIIIECPEGMGVNVYVTCYKSGMPLQRIRNLTLCRHIALIGFRKEAKTND